MELFKWYNKYSIGNDELDKHHKTLFGIFNRLYNNCVLDDNGSSLEPIINELVSYTKYHFSAEEQYMRDVEYKNIDNHILEHKIFTDRILDFQNDNNVYHCEQSKELIAYLGNWLLNHVMLEDKKISV